MHIATAASIKTSLEPASLLSVQPCSACVCWKSEDTENGLRRILWANGPRVSKYKLCLHTLRSDPGGKGFRASEIPEDN